MTVTMGWLYVVTLFTGVQAENVRVEFLITAPSDTPKDAEVYLTGSIPEMGGWNLPGLRTKQLKDGRYQAKVELPVGAQIEYKVTQGSWESVEKNAGGGEIANRTYTVEGPARIEIVVGRWAGAAKAVAKKPGKTVTGDVRVHEDFASKHLGNSRTITVYLPPGYEKDAKRRYPVLYMHDGQNLFDASKSFIGVEWQADETAERMIKAGEIEPLIIVGLYNTPERMTEYAPDIDEDRQAGGKGDAYAKFLVEEVKPFIDKTYRTKPDRENTGVAGSSMGGLISLHICRKYPKMFSRCGVISPALMWNDRSILKELESDHKWMKGMRVWVDMGSEEGRQIAGFSSAMKDTRRLAKILDDAGLQQDRDYRYLEVSGGQHNESAWSARFDQILAFFYGRE
ncbi:MAG TPA: alpha/beta hydrolase-fold protein [Phycisphaerae bacterium]|nr:alpha/beta hydrolase-fold protein [Phycisphaerae bacterium]